ncbi:MAG TPA: DUF222 domain-containing protein [Candidatus Microbacterium pullistercoris]|nr:DUF222 domain-containing protein [Candidatus Microbacterium pullistercoris]
MDTERAASHLSGLSPALVARKRALVDAVAERDRIIARAEGEKAGFLAELATIAHSEGERSPAPNGIEDARRAMAAEVAAATHTHPVAAKHQLSDAETLVDDYPTTHQALREGRISARHARAVAEAGGSLDPNARAALDHAAVPFAERCTPGDLKRIVKKQVAELAPLSLRERHEQERERRFVSLFEREDGMSDLLLYLPTFEARAVYDRATTMAKLVKTDRRRARDDFHRAYGHAVGDECSADCGCGGATRLRPPEERPSAPAATRVRGDDGGCASADTSAGSGTGGRGGERTSEDTDAMTPSVVAATDLRTMDQLRVDILTDLFLSSQPTGHELHSTGSGAALENVNATVQVTIPVDQMIDPHAGTSWIDEGALVSPDTARGIAGRAAGWERLFCRPETGEIERVDHYRPTAAQRRALIGRDMTCRFPGCTIPARKADIDHTRAYAEGGETSLSNLAALCESHHMMKHGSAWTPRQLPGGVIEWTSPTGRTYRDEPASRVFFQPAPDTPPPEPPPTSRRAESSGDRTADAAAPGADTQRAETSITCAPKAETLRADPPEVGSPQTAPLERRAPRAVGTPRTAPPEKETSHTEPPSAERLRAESPCVGAPGSGTSNSSTQIGSGTSSGGAQRPDAVVPDRIATPCGQLPHSASVVRSRRPRDAEGFARILDELEAERRARAGSAFEHAIARDREQRNAALARQRYAERREDSAEQQRVSGGSERLD